ncbi:MAG: hypothetical protein FWE22_05985 [Firmicutes bacterium]|nr:hypothetical protein [Bacillota bacterium]
MRTIKKRKEILIFAGLFVIAILMGLGGLVGCGNLSEEDFRLTLEVSQTEGRVGDTIVATATFENLSGRNIRARTRLHNLDYFGNVNNFLQLGALPETVYREMYRGSATLSTRTPQRTLQRDAFLKRKTEFAIFKQEDYLVIARVVFNYGRRNETILMKEIRINIGG